MRQRTDEGGDHDLRVAGHDIEQRRCRAFVRDMRHLDVRHEREELGREVTATHWFQALACFKSTATWSLIVKHNRRRTTPDPALERMAETLPHLLERAQELLS